MSYPNKFPLPVDMHGCRKNMAHLYSTVERLQAVTAIHEDTAITCEVGQQLEGIQCDGIGLGRDGHVAIFWLGICVNVK